MSTTLKKYMNVYKRVLNEIKKRNNNTRGPLVRYASDATLKIMIIVLIMYILQHVMTRNSAVYRWLYCV